MRLSLSPFKHIRQIEFVELVIGCGYCNALMLEKKQRRLKHLKVIKIKKHQGCDWPSSQLSLLAEFFMVNLQSKNYNHRVSMVFTFGESWPKIFKDHWKIQNFINIKSDWNPCTGVHWCVLVRTIGVCKSTLQWYHFCETE